MTIECPIRDYNCPHCNSDEICALENPVMECDDCYAEMGYDDEEEDF